VLVVLLLSAAAAGKVVVSRLVHFASFMQSCSCVTMIASCWTTARVVTVASMK
jgi:hypothetical protein